MRAAVAIAAAIAMLWVPPAVAASFSTRALDLSGSPRTYCEYVPPRLAADAPVVLYLHGALSGNCATDKFGKYWANLAQATRGFMVLAPQAPDTYWNACSAPPEVCAAPAWASETANRDDVGFVRALLALYPGRAVRVSGMSAGGMFAYLVACHVNGIQAAHVVAGVSRAQSCPGGPVPLLHMHGDADAYVPWGGSASYPPAQPGLDLRAWANGCTGPAAETWNALKKRAEYAYPGCAAPVLYYRYACAHGWPGQYNSFWDWVFGTSCSTSWRAEIDALAWWEQ